jgi:dihydroneopterin aldolase
MKDIIRLVGLSFYGYHGMTAAEKETGRIFEVDCDLELDLAPAGSSDDISDTVDYSLVFAAIRDVVEGKAYALLERLAADLAGILLDKFPIYGVTLKVRKLNPPVDGQARYIEVEVTRRQGDSSKLTSSELDKRELE